jgi:hypothetical protein
MADVVAELGAARGPGCHVGTLRRTERVGPGGAEVWECAGCGWRTFRQGRRARLREREQRWVRKRSGG